jgi:hypothetical protein
MVAAPMLTNSDQKHGAPFVDDEDVPLELVCYVPVLSQEDVDMGVPDDNHLSWDYILDEMIWV